MSRLEVTLARKVKQLEEQLREARGELELLRQEKRWFDAILRRARRIANQGAEHVTPCAMGRLSEMIYNYDRGDWKNGPDQGTALETQAGEGGEGAPPSAAGHEGDAREGLDCRSGSGHRSADSDRTPRGSAEEPRDRCG